MIRIGKSYIERRGSVSRLCADVTIGDRRNTLWFAVDKAQEQYLAVGRADPFVMAFLAAAMRGGHEIVCDDPMSARLHYQLESALIPALAFAVDRYQPVPITAPLTAEPYPSAGGVGAAFSSGVDSLYTIMTHGGDCEFPVTHIVVYNSSHYDQFGEKRERMFRAGCRQAIGFAREQGLEAVIVDTNFNVVLGTEPRLSVVTFRSVACTLALQGLFSQYLLSSTFDEGTVSLRCNKLDEHYDCEEHDRLTLASSGTESLTFYLSGGEVKRWQKMQKLADWEPSYRWLHPCWLIAADGRNCGHCSKCICDLVALYALGPDTIDKYAGVYDIPDFLRHLPQRIAYVMASIGSKQNRDFSIRASDTFRLLQDSGAYIPPAAYVYARQFRRAMDRGDWEKRESEP